MENLDDFAILEIVTKISNFDDLRNFCKSSNRIQTICKERKVTICKAFLKNIGYTNFSGITESPCKLMLKLQSVPTRITKRIVKKMLLDDSDQLLRLLAINGKIDNNILYDICSEIIDFNQFKLLKKLHIFTDYNFQSNGKPSLVVLAAIGHAIGETDPIIIKYILDNGGNIDEEDISFLQNPNRNIDPAIIELIRSYPQNVIKKKPFVISDEISSFFGF
jgi:hypothetical protein